MDISISELVNGALLLFLALLGALTVVIATAGGSRAYAEWVTTHVKNARAASILTALLGIIIFVDDYFNCLTVGAVMRPVTAASSFEPAAGMRSLAAA